MMRYQRRVGRRIASMVMLVTVMGVLGCARGDQEAEREPEIAARRAERSRVTVRLVYPEWSSEIASAHLVQAVLQERLGYQVDLEPVTVEDMWERIAHGDADVLSGAWLPVTHRDYYAEYAETLDDLGPYLEGARIGLVVPTVTPGRRVDETGRTGTDLVTIESIVELTDNVGQFGGRVVGIESGAGIMARTKEALSAYSLDRSYRLLEFDEEKMLASVSDSVRRGEWIVFTGWTPHWMFERFNLRFLDDPIGVYGGRESIHILVRTGFGDEHADAREVLERIRMEPRDLERLMLWIHDDAAGDTYAQALRWLQMHPDHVNSWVEGIE